MTNEEVYGSISGLLENAIDAGNEKYEETFARTLAMLDEHRMLHDICTEYEKKMIEVMGKQAFYNYATQLSKDLWRRHVEQLPDSEFKKFSLENFDRIAAEVENETQNWNMD